VNSFKGHITYLETADALSLVSICTGSGLVFKTVLIDTPETAPYLSEGNEVQVLFKETEVIISTDENPAISLQNRIPCTVTAVERSQILSRIVLETPDGPLVSVISTAATESLGLAANSKVMALIKLNEITLAP
jgi:molybdate transport system regulatory protein